jgi:hypothetical protein
MYTCVHPFILCYSRGVKNDSVYTHLFLAPILHLNLTYRMSRKSKPQKTYSGTIDYGDTYQYKDAKYWVYLRKRSSNQPIGKIWQIRKKIKNHPDLRKSSGTESFETAKDKAKEMIFESFYEIETGHKIKSRKFK